MIDKTIEPDTYTGQYYMHKYWSKKPYNIVEEYIRTYTEEGDIVLDPFCGSGVTAAESVKNGRRAIASDLNPIATFITRNTVKPIEVDRFEQTFNLIKEDIHENISNLYQLQTPHGGSINTSHVIWENDEPVEIWYKCEHCGKVKREPTADEKDQLMKNRDTGPFHWSPNVELMQNSRINLKEPRNVRDLFTPRNLKALSMIWNRISQIDDEDIKESMKFAFTTALPQASKLVFVINRDGKKQVGSWVAGFWTPDEYFEINAWRCFRNGYKRVKRGKSEIENGVNIVESYESLEANPRACLIKKADAKTLKYLPNRAEVDYIFTDPPYGDSQPYFEQSMLWGAWLGSDFNFENEIVISDSNEREKGFEDYAEGLRTSFARMNEVLKEDGYASIAFNNIGNETWNALVDAYTSTNFQLFDVHHYDSSAGNVKQDSRENALEGEFILTLKKSDSPAPEMEGVDEQEVVDIATNILVEGGALTTHELYNSVIIQMLENNMRNHANKDLIDIFRNNLSKTNGKWEA